jgi:hypothetical protein
VRTKTKDPPEGENGVALESDADSCEYEQNEDAELCITASETSSCSLTVRLLVRCSPAIRYVARLGLRYAVGLLEPFQCALCSKLSLDPIRWLGSGRPLCGACADPEALGADE